MSTPPEVKDRKRTKYLSYISLQIVTSGTKVYTGVENPPVMGFCFHARRKGSYFLTLPALSGLPVTFHSLSRNEFMSYKETLAYRWLNFKQPKGAIKQGTDYIVFNLSPTHALIQFKQKALKVLPKKSKNSAKEWAVLREKDHYHILR